MVFKQGNNQVKPGATLDFVKETHKRSNIYEAITFSNHLNSSFGVENHVFPKKTNYRVPSEDFRGLSVEPFILVASSNQDSFCEPITKSKDHFEKKNDEVVTNLVTRFQAHGIEENPLINSIKSSGNGEKANFLRSDSLLEESSTQRFNNKFEHHKDDGKKLLTVGSSTGLMNYTKEMGEKQGNFADAVSAVVASSKSSQSSEFRKSKEYHKEDSSSFTTDNPISCIHWFKNLLTKKRKTT